MADTLLEFIKEKLSQVITVNLTISLLHHLNMNLNYEFKLVIVPQFITELISQLHVVHFNGEYTT